MAKNKMYRTALGKQVDMGSLLLKNEDVRAVGNMGVNAKGDIINKKNMSTVSKPVQVAEHYRKQIRNQIMDEPVSICTKTTALSAVDDVIEGLDTGIVKNTTVLPATDTPVDDTKTNKKTGGLASAIAKAREVEQKKILTPREVARGKKGVNKI